MKTRSKVFRGDRLRQLREARGFSQDELAAQLGFGAAQMNRYENGKADPSLDGITRIANALQVTTDWLLGLTDDPQSRLEEDEITPEEWQLLNHFRRDDLEGLMRVALDSVGQKKDRKARQSES